jgi:hypothetical protein
MRLWKAMVATAALCAAMLATSAAPARADAVTGGCYGEGTWEGSGQVEKSVDHDPTDVIVIPQSDTVDWVGGIGDNRPPAEGPPRVVAGAVQLRILGKWVTIDSWAGEKTGLANSGTKHYDLSSMLIGIKMKLRGFHHEPNINCKGSVFVKVEGSTTSNPLFWAGGVLFVLSLAGLVYAGRPRLVRTA